jgi:hypothetical protein
VSSGGASATGSELTAVVEGGTDDTELVAAGISRSVAVEHPEAANARRPASIACCILDGPRTRPP